MRTSSSRPGSVATLLAPLLIIALIVLLLMLDARRRSAEERLRQMSVRLEQLEGNPQQNREKAIEVVAKIKRLIDISDEIEPTVATIVDVVKLRERNPFYDKAENGDYLIVTPTRAILYDPETDKILDVVPVQIEAPAAGAASSAQSSAVSS